MAPGFIAITSPNRAVALPYRHDRRAGRQEPPARLLSFGKIDRRQGAKIRKSQRAGSRPTCFIGSKRRRRLNEQHDQGANDKTENLKLERNRVEQEITETLTASRHDTHQSCTPAC